MARSWWPAAGVLAGALALFGFGVGRAGIASGWVDPVAKIAAQDEAVYSHTALGMARQGDWLTPRFLGRLALYKAPALYWFSGLSVKLAGPSRVALRMPSLVAAALIALAVFAWTRRLAGPIAGLAAALLWVLNPLAHTLARMNLTDMPLAAWTVGALAALAADPALGRKRSAVLAGVCSGMAVLTKGVAGLLPLLMLAAWWIAARREQRPAAGRLILAAVIAAAVSLPWHCYQLAAHPRWFWAEYIRDEIFFWGAGAPPQTTAESQAWFYVRRAALTDPLLLCLAVTAGAAAAWRRQAEARLPAVWIATVAAAVLAFRYRNIAYLLPAVPALAILAGAYLPLWRGRTGAVALAALAALVPVKAWQGDRAWGLPFYRGTVPSGQVLASYCEMGRPSELIVVSPDDEFLSAALPLERVRYVFLMPAGYHDRRALDFHYLGIVVSVDEFLRLPELAPVFSRRLREWNQERDAPIATSIVARSEEEIRRLIEHSPERDFLVPNRFVSAEHEIRAAPPARLLLLARTGAGAARFRAGCGL
jgi:hypothetical protein